jgi:ATP-dependent exoDNAse (exonuclease V) alpha subunit
MVIVHIIFNESQDPQHDLPEVVMVYFPGYTGPSLWHDEGSRPLVPIAPLTVWSDGKGGASSITQFPLTPAYGVSIHKSQGMTLDKVKIELGPKDFSRGLSFVAVSRAKRLSSIAFRTSFPIERLQRLSGCSHFQDDLQRRNLLGFRDEMYGQNMLLYTQFSE